MTLPDGKFTSYAYDVVNNSGMRTTITDPLGKQKRYLYDAFGRLTRVEEERDQLGTLVETARYTYDAAGHLLTVEMTDHNNVTQRRDFTYCKNMVAPSHEDYCLVTGPLKTATNIENGRVTYTYDGNGMLAIKTDAKNQKLQYSYDGYRRLTTIAQQLPGENYWITKTTFGYDTDSIFNTTSYGRMTTAANDGYTWHFAHDNFGRVTKQTLETPYQILDGEGNPLGTQFLQAMYGYNDDGNLESLWYPLSGTLSDLGNRTEGPLHYDYDVAGRPLKATEDNPNSFWAQNAQYNVAGQLTSWQERNATLSRSYDTARGWLTDMTASGNALNLHYTYFGDGRVQSVTDAVTPSLSAVYQYDSLSRLGHATAGQTETDPNHSEWKRIQSGTVNWELQWTYDDFGNRTNQQVLAGSAPALALTYSQTTNRITGTGYGYDNNGNLTSIPSIGGRPAVTSMQYDVFDRLQAAWASNSWTTYKYDAFGRRVEKTTAMDGTTQYFYDMSGRLLSYGGGGKVFVYFGGQRVGQYADRLGSTRRTSAGVDPPSTSSYYYPFGEEPATAPTPNDRYKFAETYRDATTGLDYAMNRYYASGIGRFLSVDIAGPRLTVPQSFNRYTYALDDPIGLVDPSGTNAADPMFEGCVPDPFGYIAVDASNRCPPGYVFVFSAGIIGGIIGAVGGGGGGGGAPPPKLDCSIVEWDVGPIVNETRDPSGLSSGWFQPVSIIAEATGGTYGSVAFHNEQDISVSSIEKLADGSTYAVQYSKTETTAQEPITGRQAIRVVDTPGPKAAVGNQGVESFIYHFEATTRIWATSGSQSAECGKMHWSVDMFMTGGTAFSIVGPKPFVKLGSGW